MNVNYGFDIVTLCSKFRLVAEIITHKIRKETEFFFR
jgi:hypothetical protein